MTETFIYEDPYNIIHKKREVRKVVVEKKCEYVLRYKTSVEKWDGITHILEDMGEEELAKIAGRLRDYIAERGDVVLPQYKEVVVPVQVLSDIPYMSEDVSPCPHCYVFHKMAEREAAGRKNCDYCFLHQPGSICCPLWDEFQEVIWRKIKGED